MNKTKEEYDKDERIPCKYGSSCYQKNQSHHEKYKHPGTSVPNKEKPETRFKNLSVKTGPLKQQKLADFFSPKRKIDQVVPEASREQNEAKRKENTTKETEFEESKIEDEDSSEKSEADKIENMTSSEDEDVKDNTKKSKGDDIETTTSAEEDDVKEDVPEEDGRRIIKKLFLVDMPEDFYSFWKLCKTLSPQNPKDAFSSIDLTLVGPFDVLAGTLKEDSVSSSEAILHWRYYYDPPEFQTILKSDKDLFHLGYFRDDPNSPPVFVAFNSAAKNSLITPVAENIFGAVDWYMNQSDKAGNPFKKMKSTNLRTSLHKWAKDHNFTLEKHSKKMLERNKAVVSKTFHQAGIVVPYDKKTQVGYRPLSETPSDLKKLLKKIEDASTPEERMAHLNSLHTVANWANIAMDESDFGTSLELGLNLFSYGTDHFNSIIRSSLRNAYNFLGRQTFATIIEAHLDRRKRGGDLNILKNK